MSSYFEIDNIRDDIGDDDFNDSYSDYSDNSYNGVLNFEYSLQGNTDYLNDNKTSHHLAFLDYKNPEEPNVFDEDLNKKMGEESTEEEQEEQQEQEEQEEEEYKPVKLRKYDKKTKKSNITVKKISKRKPNPQFVRQTTEERSLRNRESARLCRLRKKEYINSLEQRILLLTEENNKLKALITFNVNKQQKL